MLFGKIDYLNLLPFYIFLQKKYPKLKHFKKGVPSEINRKFHRRQVDMGFISSVTSKKSRCSNLGIIATKEVLSVLVLDGEAKRDSASETSNRLAEVLNFRGEVIIGDRALQHYFKDGSGIDLALEWQKRFHLPFVFAKMCYHKNKQTVRNIERSFYKERVYIPYYIIQRVEKRLHLSRREILEYLSKIDYRCDGKSKKGLQKFLQL